MWASGTRAWGAVGEGRTQVCVEHPLDSLSQVLQAGVILTEGCWPQKAQELGLGAQIFLILILGALLLFVFALFCFLLLFARDIS